MSNTSFAQKYRRPFEHELPSGWTYVEIGKVLKESKANNRPDLPLYSVTRNKGIIPQAESDKRDTSSLNKSKYKVIRPNDIVYNTMRMWQGVVALSQVNGIVSPAYTVCTPNKEVSSEFVNYLFKSKPMINLFHRFSQGLVDDTLNLKYENLKRIQMPLPPLKEQKKIVSILSSVDKVIAITESVIYKLEKLKMGLAKRLLTQGIGHQSYKKTDLGEIPQAWEVKNLEELVTKIIGGGTPSRSNAEYYTGNIPWVTVKDISYHYLSSSVEYISEDAIRNSATNLIPKGNIIVATRMALGKAFINNVDMSINQDLKALIPNRNYINPDFLLYSYLNKSKEIEMMGTGTTVKGIRLEHLKSLKFAVPTLDEQKKIVDILSTTDDRYNKELETLNQLQKLKLSLLQSLLTGKVRGEIDEIEVVLN